MIECWFPANMERASRVLGKLSLPQGTISPESMVCAAWTSAVGKKIAAHARAAKLVRTHLIVEVEDVIWQRQLFVLREQIRRKIDESVGAGVVEDIEFRVMPARLGPRRAQLAVRAAGDEASDIADPVLRNIYRASRKRQLA